MGTETLYNINQLLILLDNVNDAILYESLDNKIVFVNNSFCKLFNIFKSPQELIGVDSTSYAIKCAILFMNPEFYIRGISNIYDNKKDVLDDELILKNGNIIYRDYKPVSNKNKKCGHLWIYKSHNKINDIVKIMESQVNYYQNLLQNIPADIAIFDKSHKYTFINKNGISLNDRREWIIGKDDFEYFSKYNKPLDLAKSRREKFLEAVQTKKVVEFEENNSRNDGKIIYNLRRFYPVINEKGEVDSVVGYGINVTNIREQEKLIKEKEIAFKKIVGEMDQAVIIINSNFKIEYINKAWCTLTGKTQEECLQKELHLFFSKYKMELIVELSSFMKNEIYEFKKNKVCLQSYENKTITCLYYVIKISKNLSGEILYAIFLYDITSQLKAENELKSIAKKERKLNTMKSNFMSLVSHQLRTPLSVILSNVELIDFKLSQLSSYVNNPIEIFTKRILEQIDKMTLLMNDFLFISKIESGNFPFKPIHFDISELILQIKEEAFSPWKDGRNLNFTISGNKKNIYADKVMMTHCITNILDNAFKYSQGKLVPEIHLTFNENDWVIDILDYGIGIPNQDKRNLYKPFSRGSNIEEIEGTGLGLMIVKQFVKKNKGIVIIKSQINKGTNVHLKFPY